MIMQYSEFCTLYNTITKSMIEPTIEIDLSSDFNIINKKYHVSSNISQMIKAISDEYKLTETYEKYITIDLDTAFNQINKYEHLYEIIQINIKNIKMLYTIFEKQINNNFSHVTTLIIDELNPNKIIDIINKQMREFSNLLVFISTTFSTFVRNLTIAKNIKTIINTYSIQFIENNETIIDIAPNIIYNLVTMMKNALEKANDMLPYIIQYFKSIDEIRELIKNNICLIYCKQ